jgi:hypothetical protein
VKTAEMPTVGVYAVERGGCGVWFLVDNTDRIRGTLFHNGGGWWKGVEPSGERREIFIGDVDEPHMVIAQRLTDS